MIWYTVYYTLLKSLSPSLQKNNFESELIYSNTYIRNVVEFIHKSMVPISDVSRLFSQKVNAPSLFGGFALQVMLFSQISHYGI